MSVYVDHSRPCLRNPDWPYDTCCHMWADTEEELHELARRIGLKRRWFQKEPDRLPHYDLTASMRVEALEAGATPANWYDFKRAVKQAREEGL